VAHECSEFEAVLCVLE